MPVTNPASAGLPVFNVKTTYGAKGDGVADDSTPILNAITAASNAGGGTVFLPAGVYLLPSWGYTASSTTGVKLVGQAGVGVGGGTPATIVRFSVAAGSAANPIIDFTGSHGLELRDIQWEATAIAAGGQQVKLMDFNTSTDLTISRCTIQYTGALANDYGIGISLGSTSRAVIERCYINNLFRGIDGGSSSSYVDVRDCYFNENASMIWEAPTHWTIINNQFVQATAPSGGGWFIPGNNAVANLTIMGNRFTSSVAVNGFINVGGSNISIINNYFSGTSTSYGAIRTPTAVPGMFVQGNYFSVGNPAIDFNSVASTGVVSGNVFSAGTTTRYANNGSLTSAMAITDELTTPGKSTNVQVFTSSGTWTKPANAVAVDVVCIGGGGGGGGGVVGPTSQVNYGGWGGSGGGYTTLSGLQALNLPATVAVTVGTGGAGGAGGASVGSASSAGSNGNASSFGTYVYAGGGIGGPGILADGSTGTGAQALGTNVVGTLYTPNNGGQGGSGGATALPVAGGNTATGPGGGGGGGGAYGGSPGTAGAGAAGGYSAVALRTGGTAGAANPTAAPAAPSVPAGFAGPGGGGGGGGGFTATGTAANRNGGAGVYGGGGGGGGGGYSGFGGGGTGGAGGAGVVVVTSYF